MVSEVSVPGYFFWGVGVAAIVIETRISCMGDVAHLTRTRGERGRVK